MVERKKANVRKTLVKSKRPPSRRRKKSTQLGRQTNLTLIGYLENVFLLNEEQVNKYTDDDILESCKVEFGRSSKTLIYLMSKHSATLGSCRTKLNKEQKRDICFLRYNSDNFPCGNYDKPKSKAQVRDYCLHCGIVDPRFFSPAEIKVCAERKKQGREGYEHLRIPSPASIKKFTYGCVEFGAGDDFHIEV